MTFASKTTVPEARSRDEIERTLARYGADLFVYVQEQGRAEIMFRSDGRRVRFVLHFPAEKEMTTRQKYEQARRSLWRSLLLCIKSKLESVEAGIEVFDEAFLGQIVMPNGRTVIEETLPQIEQAYESGDDGPLLLTVGKGNR